jgi:hypothetical protein
MVQTRRNFVKDEMNYEVHTVPVTGTSSLSMLYYLRNLCEIHVTSYSTYLATKFINQMQN